MADDTDSVIASIEIERAKRASTPVAICTMPDPKEGWPNGPFTVTITGPDGKKMWEVVFPDATGDLPADAAVLFTGGIVNVNRLLANLLSGTIRALMGAR